jgi:lipoprotein-releasing system ATP-binding protein
MLEAIGIRKNYDSPNGSIPILENISIEWKRGQAVSIMGPSGSGKSTFLYILGVLDTPTAGTLRLEGQDPFSLDEKQQAAFRNRHVGFLFQDHCLLPQCSVLENVLAPVLVDGRPHPDTIQRAQKLLQQVGLSDRLDHRPGQLSGGEKQRAALARALIRQPLLLLCDEPTGNLDHKASETVAELLLQLHAEQKTILVVVTHNAELADRFPTRMEMYEHNLRTR